MKPAKKKPAKKSSKSRRATPVKKKATQKITARSVSVKKPSAVKAKSSETSALKKVKTENKRLTAQLKEKKRALEIEAALEQVRARTMAMQRSDELHEAAVLLFNQAKALGASAWSCGYNIWDDDRKASTAWMGNTELGIQAKSFKVPTHEHVFKSIFEAAERGESLFVHEISGEAVGPHYQYMYSLPEAGYRLKNFVASGGTLPAVQILHCAFFSKGYLLFITLEPIPALWDVFKRFAKVFEQTYTRFLDLQKAEAQAREAQIEVALERIRAKAMAMQSSAELMSVANTLREQMRLIGQPGLESSMILLYDEEKFTEEDWFAFLPPKRSRKKILTGSITWRLDENEVVKKLFKIYKSGVSESTFNVRGRDLKQILDDLTQKYPIIIEYFGEQLPENVIHYVTRFSGGHILMTSYESPDEKSKDLQRRVTSTFDLAFKRFLDLQKAEAQAREAKIEAALERVRSRSMAMHKSEELNEIVGVLYREMEAFGFARSGCELILVNEKNEMLQFWNSNPVQNNIQESFNIPKSIHPFFEKQWKAWSNKTSRLTITLEGEEKKTFDQLILTKTDFKHLPEDVKKFIRNHGVDVFSFAIMKYGLLEVVDAVQISEEMFSVLERFAKVFEQTYTRFLDLQKAEAQARESQVQLALERVRARTMAMQHSDELKEAALVLFNQIQSLGTAQWACGFNIWDDDKKASTAWIGSATGFHAPFKTESSKDIFKPIYEAAQRGESLFVIEQIGKELEMHYEYMGSIPAFRDSLLEDWKKAGIPIPKFQIFHAAYFSQGYLIFISFEPIAAYHDIFKRFAKVFEQTYTRFLDLQKAEAQAREAQIEASLERVRSRSMAMHSTEELENVSSVVYEELIKLGITTFQSCGFHIIDEQNEIQQVWNFHIDLKQLSRFQMPIKGDPILDARYAAWKQRENVFYQKVEGQQLNDHLAFISGPGLLLGSASSWTEKFDFPDPVHFHFANFSSGYLHVIATKALSEEYKTVLGRFATVFEQTYTRFLDLQKAEAQAREAEIQLALERVRARTMAMHNSDELHEASKVLYQELAKLGFASMVSAFSLMSEDEKTVWYYFSNAEDGATTSVPMGTPCTETQPMRALAASWKKQETYHIVELDARETIAHQTFIAERSINAPFTAAELISFSPKELKLHSFNFKQGYLLQGGGERLSPDQIDIMIRFTKAFQMTYTRFLDLQKAEEQAREAKIEASLERVRSRAMAMHRSEELGEVATVLHSELIALHVHEFSQTSIIIHDEPGQKLIVWGARTGSGSLEKSVFPLLGDPVLQKLYDAWRQEEEFLTVKVEGEALRNHIDFVLPKASRTVEEDAAMKNMPDPTFFHCAYFCMGYLELMSDNELIEASSSLLVRFAKVFDQAYRRFLDLHKAETQAKEATIEAALEKVRGKAMAMHDSNDLIATAGLVFTELRKLGINPMRCGVSLHNRENRKNLLYAATSTEEGDNLSMVGWAMLDDHPVLSEIYDSWLRGEDYFPELRGEELITYYEKIKSSFVVPPTAQSGYEHFGYFLAFAEGAFYGWSEKPFAESEIKILKRFASVIDLTFRRYIELQKSEANAIEAIRRSSLDRVRAEIASMRSTADLERITPLIWNELTTLGVPFVRCGVFIMDELQEKIHTFLSTPDGKAIASFDTPFSTPGALTDALPYWRKKEMYKVHWDEAAFLEQARALVERGAISSPEMYLTENRPTDLHLNFLPFLQGMLYVGNVAPLGDEDLRLVQNLADAFSTAYARYEDFNKLEAAKQTVEKALTDLKQTQAQLVQSEKMASLGELTAGIAHEIQNPLNFVNNFSEVNTELIDELEVEINRGDFEEAKAIAKDIKENEQKINHHGRRADAIVKGMLQHSRSSSGVKEPTNINALCDEYLRLAYHGLRAKDNTFNAKFGTSFDESLDKVEVIPQDIGRVILNLITNAFYAVIEKKRQSSDGYEPMVTVTTIHSRTSPGAAGGEVLIKVKDNGNGIPQNVMDKIFQPFFTTKPTGQGTGLGLSLSYDIVKAHGGEVTVVSKDGEGSEFIIKLPFLNLIE